jgi:hypothetical protein
LFKAGVLARVLDRERYTPVRLSLAADGPLGQPELWTSLGVKQRPSLTLLAIVSVPDLAGVPAGEPVLRRTLKLKQGAARGREDVVVLSDTFAVRFRGQAARNRKTPVALATVLIAIDGGKPAASTTTDAEGQFDLAVLLAPGPHHVRLWARGTAFVEEDRPLEVFAEEERTVEVRIDEKTGQHEPTVVKWGLNMKEAGAGH